MTSARRLIITTILATAFLIAIAGALFGYAVLVTGWYDIGATTQHWQPVHTLLEEGMRHSVRRHARDISMPELAAPQAVGHGARLYHRHCMQCHGGPGVAQAVYAMSMQPVPGSLINAAKHWSAGEMYWITRNGIKMSGMPAWEFHMSDRDLWSVVAFLGRLPALSPSDYAALTASVAATP